jgi:hypothetical protein
MLSFSAESNRSSYCRSSLQLHYQITCRRKIPLSSTFVGRERDDSVGDGTDRDYSGRELFLTSSLSTIASAISFMVFLFCRLWRWMLR